MSAIINNEKLLKLEYCQYSYCSISIIIVIVIYAPIEIWISRPYLDEAKTDDTYIFHLRELLNVKNSLRFY